MKLSVTFKPQTLTVSVRPDSLGIGFKPPIARDFENRPPYEGDYVITPLVHNEIVLETNGKRMTDDVTIRKVPYYETANFSGGNTAYIGEN